MAGRLVGRTFVLASLLFVAAGAMAREDDDPGNGQSWLTEIAEHDAREGRLWAGTIRATDDYGATHDRDFRLAVTGSMARGDRKAVLNRYEPECFELAPAARLSLDDYCDQLTLTWRDGDATIAFSSLDANRRYAFTLRSDPRSPDDWVSLTPDVPAPSLRLASHGSSEGVSYRWELDAREAIFRQAGEVSSAELRHADLHPLEVGLLGLGEVLLTFNRYAFERDSLPRDHPSYEASPYSAWAEETVEGGCIGWFCFGNLGGGGGSAGNNNNACTPGSPSYNSTLCPHDLTYARWPVAMRPKLQKLSNDAVVAVLGIKNAGTGPAYISAYPGSPHFVFFSLIQLGSATPLVDANAIASSPYGGDCYSAWRELSFEVVNPFMIVDLDAGKSHLLGPVDIKCRASSGRPEGRYRLHIHVDPANVFDTPGFAGNNIGNSGPLDWVRLRN